MADPWDNVPVVRSRTTAQPQQAGQNPWDSIPVVSDQSQSAPRAAARQAARPQVRFADDRDALIRTVIGEAQAEPPEGQAAVAAVILNRARQRGMTPSQVVLETNQFEPWGNPKTASRLAGISPNDPLYQSAAAQVDRALSGYDPTGGADHFYAPVAQQALGRNAPSWAVGEPTVIGGHNFYSLGGSTEDARMAAAGGVEAPVEVVDEFAVDPVAEAPAVGTRENPIDLTDRNQAILAKKGDWVRLENGDLTRAAADAVEGAKGDQQGSGAYAYTPNAIDAAGAGALAASEQIPFLDESVAFTTGLATGEGYDAMRERQQALAQVDRQAQPLARNAGGVAGFATGLLAPGAGYIGRGANAAQMAGRAAQVGAIGGGIYGAGAADDSYASRLSGLGQGAVVGAATGGLFQMGANRLNSGAMRSINAPASQARRLSRAGIDLTPGQMAAEIPVVGPAIRALEEGASSIPVAGAAISGARQRGIENFNRVVIDRALEPLGVTIPENIPAGYPAVEFAQQALSRAYDDVLQDVQIVADRTLYDGLGQAINDAVTNSGAPGGRRIAREVADRVFRYLGDDAATPIDGQQFKALESEFTNLASNALSATDGGTRAVGRDYQAVNDTLRDALEAQNPGKSEALRRVNDAYSRMVRVETAAGSSASQAAEGVFSPTQLGAAVGSQSGRRASARGDANMQELVGPARGILNSRLGDSGTATRGAVTALASGAAGTATVMNPAVAIPVIVGVSAAYSRPAQRAINDLYRSADNPGAAQRHLARLASLAQRDPALQPYYQEAVRFVTQQEPLRQQQPASQNQTPRQRQAG